MKHIEEWIEKSLVTVKYGENQTIFESAISEYQPTKVLIRSLGMNLEDGATLQGSYTTTSFTSDYFIKLTSADLNTRYFDEFYQGSRKFKEFIEILSNIPFESTVLEKLGNIQLLLESNILEKNKSHNIKL